VTQKLLVKDLMFCLQESFGDMPTTTTCSTVTTTGTDSANLHENVEESESDDFFYSLMEEDAETLMGRRELERSIKRLKESMKKLKKCE